MFWHNRVKRRTCLLRLNRPNEAASFVNVKSIFVFFVAVLTPTFICISLILYEWLERRVGRVIDLCWAVPPKALRPKIFTIPTLVHTLNVHYTHSYSLICRFFLPLAKNNYSQNAFNKLECPRIYRAIVTYDVMWRCEHIKKFCKCIN